MSQISFKIRSYSVRLLAAFAIAALYGCQTTPNEKALSDQMVEALQSEPMPTETSTELEAIPAAVQQMLNEPPAQDNALFGEARYDIDAQDVEVRAFFTGLVTDTPFSVAIHPDVAGQISLSLKQVTMGQVFELIGELYGYDIHRKGTVFRVRPAGLRTETYPVNYLLMQRDGNTQTSIISGGVSQNGSNNSTNQGNSPFNNFSGNSQNSNNLGGSFGNNSNGTSISTRSETNFWEDLKASLAVMIGEGDGRAVVVMPQAGLVTVRAFPDELKVIEHYLRASEASLQRQVILEARILEVSLSDEYQQGINWQDVIAHTGSTDFQFSTSAATLGNSISASLGGITSLSFLNQDFSGVLELLSTQGNVQVLSSPRVTATNNQKAVIKVGDDEYFVTDVSSQNTITSTTTSVVPDIELTPFFSGIALDVTPQIDQSGSVLLHVHPSVIETREQEKVVTLNQEQIVLPLAQSSIRESDTVIKAQSGEIVVIGGLMQTSRTETNSKTPLLGDIPLLGELFKNRRDIETKKELVILLKPTVVSAGTWQQQLERSRLQMAEWLYVD